ncbi:MAG: DUF433 domain-containing protein [Bacteroidota bacterium]
MFQGFSMIEVDPDVRTGKPCLRGTRITVGDVLGYLAIGMTFEELLEDFPKLSREAIFQALAFAAARENRRDFIAA